MRPKANGPLDTMAWTTYGTYKLDITTSWKDTDYWGTNTKRYSTSKKTIKSISPTSKDDSCMSAYYSDVLLARRKWTASSVVAKDNYTCTVDYAYKKGSYTCYTDSERIRTYIGDTSSYVLVPWPPYPPEPIH